MNTDKTEVMRLADGSHDPESISVGPIELKNINDFRYLGSFLSNDCSLDNEITYRFGRAAAAFGSLRWKSLQQQGPQTDHKNKRVQSGVPIYLAVRYRNLDTLQESGKEAGGVPHSVLAEDPQHILE